MKFVKHVIHDAILWTLLLVCFFNLPYAHYAENIVSFYGIFMLVLGLISLFVIEKVGEILASNKDYKPRGKLYSLYVHISTIVEIAIVAAMGWWWVTAGFVIYSLVISCARQEADKIYDHSTR